MEPQQPASPTTENSSLVKLREAWQNLMVDYPGPRPAIAPDFEVEYYVGQVLTGAGFSIGILKDIAPRCTLEELRERVKTQMETLYKELAVTLGQNGCKNSS